MEKQTEIANKNISQRVAKTPRVNQLKRKNRTFIFLMLLYPVVQFAVFFIYVNINTVKMSFQYLNYTTMKVEYGFNNYRQFFYELFNMKAMWLGIRNSVLAMLNSNFIMMPLSFICGYLFYKKIPLAGFFKVVFFLPCVISIVVLTTVYMYMFDATVGPIPAIMRSFGFEKIPDFFNDEKYSFPLILLYCNWAGIGYQTLVLSGNINKVPKELIEYGQLEGVGLVKELLFIVVPCSWSIISMMLITGTMEIFTFFIQIQVMTQGKPDNASTSIAYIINSMVSGSSQQLEKASAFGICCTIIAMPLLIGIKRLTGRFFNDVEF